VNALDGRVDEQRLRRFLKPLRAVALDDATLYLEAPDRLSLTCVTEEFLPPIREALAALVGPRQVVIDLGRTEQGELFPVARAKRAAMPGGTLNTRHTFESFVVGSSNQFARSALQPTVPLWRRRARQDPPRVRHR
jgi:chromosomal replication initiator protein